jgi:hypothetical protein
MPEGRVELVDLFGPFGDADERRVREKLSYSR